MRDRKREMVKALVAIHLEKYKSSGAELVIGDAKFTGPAGAQGFRRDIPKADARLLDIGHFALETHVDEIALAMRAFPAGSVG